MALGTAAGGLLTAGPVDKDGMLLVDGKRTFVQGLYQTLKHPDGLKMAAEAGFQVVHAPAEKTFLEQVRKAGMRCWMTVGSDPAAIRKTVSAYAGDPALLFWETEDEPSYQWKKSGPRVSPEKIKAAYSLLKELDPGRAVYLNHAPTNLVATLQAYNPGGDILATDIYPVIPNGIRELYGLWPDGRQGDLLNTHISQVGAYADKIRQVAGPDRATFMVLQAFAWENLREKDRDTRMIVYPNREQLRFMAWQSVVHGANGILWWGLSYTPENVPFWHDLAAVTSELRTLHGPLSAPAAALPVQVTYHDTGHSLDRGLEWTARIDGSGVLLIVVNADPNPIDVSLKNLDIYRHPQIANGTLRAQFPPFGVGIYRLGR